MPSFFSLHLGRTAIEAHTKAVEVTGQNIANANTPGYTRQVVLMESVVPNISPGARLVPGQGVRIAGVERIRNEHYADQLIGAGAGQAYWESRRRALEGIEVSFLEPGEGSISEQLNAFFDAWHELSANPESAAVRMGLQSQAAVLTRGVQTTYQRLQALQEDISTELETRVTQVNKIAEEIAVINEQLIFMGALGERSNELLDQMDLRLAELSELVDLRRRFRDNGAVEVFIGGRLLVQNDRTFAIRIGDGEDGKRQIIGPHDDVYAFESGKICALLDTHNEIIPSYQSALDDLVTGLVGEVNGWHSGVRDVDGQQWRNYDLEGRPGGVFFEAVDVGSLIPASLQFEVNSAILGDHTRIAAASSPVPDPGNLDAQLDPALPGDGAGALAIARLRDAAIIGHDGEAASPTDFYRGLIGRLGVEGQESERMHTAYSAVTEQLERRQEAVSGVSTDEEMLNMLRSQHAFNAAAKFLSTADDMLAVLINELG